MKTKHTFVCPQTHRALSLAATRMDGDEVVEGELRSDDGRAYPVRSGLPYLLHPQVLQGSDAESLAWYQTNHEVYDEYLPLTFRTLGVDEGALRSEMVDRLAIRPGDKVLETGAGTGRDSLLLGARLGPEGELHVLDLFDKMLEHAMVKLQSLRARVIPCVANAVHLPYPDRYFDAYYHVGGFNTFSDKRRAFAEIARVVKPGGRVIVGDESIAPWLRETEFGAILMNSNPHYKFQPPLADMDVSSRDVSLHYVAGGAFYFIAYTIGEGLPSADFDFEIPGPRGGTLRTRLHGHLEGVSEEAVRLAKAARERSGKSMHRWLDDAIRKAALDDLKDAP
jgi:ubiquinone/menaquinone biosynthesis C-methylase UbiE/uncharacterized protein YbaR (Trm112 family)